MRSARSCLSSKHVDLSRNKLAWRGRVDNEIHKSFWGQQILQINNWIITLPPRSHFYSTDPSKVWCVVKSGHMMMVYPNLAAAWVHQTVQLNQDADDQHCQIRDIGKKRPWAMANAGTCRILLATPRCACADGRLLAGVGEHNGIVKFAQQGVPLQ